MNSLTKEIHRMIGGLMGLIFAFLALSSTAAAQSGNDDIFAVFRDCRAESKLALAYPDWDLILRSSVMSFGPSYRFIGSRSDRSTGTRISSRNKNPSWLEGNRVIFDELNESNIETITEYRQIVEGIPDQVAMSRWPKDEQLAYWLNLYTIRVYDLVARKYPIRKLERLKNGTRRKSGAWDQKLLTVAGVPLSLNDIHHEIILKNWDDPLVIYGLYQGSIGGPNIRRIAYTGKNVRRLLQLNADDFVNSIRGVHKRGKCPGVGILRLESRFVSKF